jgi:hypothetical protein
MTSTTLIETATELGANRHPKALQAVTVGRKWTMPLSQRCHQPPNGVGAHGWATLEIAPDVAIYSVPPVGLEPTLGGF